jgi:ABC-type methionine transport system ATPase subunit
VKIKKTIRFEFGQSMVKTPLLYQLNREFDVVVNIRGASISEDGGFVVLEVEGDEVEVKRVLDYLQEHGVQTVEER